MVAAKIMLARSAERHAFRPDALAADELNEIDTLLASLIKRDFAPHVPVLNHQNQDVGKEDQSHFAYHAGCDSFTCLEEQKMRLRKVDPATRIKRGS